MGIFESWIASWPKTESIGRRAALPGTDELARASKSLRNCCNLTGSYGPSGANKTRLFR